MTQQRPPIRAGVAMFPYGHYQGVPVITLDIEPQPPGALTSSEAVIGLLVKAQGFGTNALWIRSAPWGDVSWEGVLWDMLAADWLGQMPFLAIRAIGREDWSRHEIQWIADCTQLVNFDGREAAPIERRCDAIGFRPALHEIVVRSVHPTQFNSATLDGLARSMRVEQAWLYLDNDHYWAHEEEIMQTVAACSTSWGARPWVTDRLREAKSCPTAAK